MSKVITIQDGDLVFNILDGEGDASIQIDGGAINLDSTNGTINFGADGNFIGTINLGTFVDITNDDGEGGNGQLTIFGAGTENVALYHDNTNFNIEATDTTNINITGITNLTVNGTDVALTTSTVAVATALETARTIGMTGDVVWTSAGFDGTSNVTGTSTIQADSVTMDMIVDITTDTFLGRVTAATGTVEVLTNAQAKTALDLSGSNSGDQTITLTGDVTGSGIGSFGATIAADAVTYAKIQNVVADNVLLGNNAGAGGIVAELTGTQTTALLDTFATGATTQGVVPGSNSLGATYYVDGSGAWSIPAGTSSGTVTSSSSPLVNEVAVFTASTDIAGDANFVWDGTNLILGTTGGSIRQADTSSLAGGVVGHGVYYSDTQTWQSQYPGFVNEDGANFIMADFHGFYYTFSTLTGASDPGVGFIRFDAAMAAATNIYVDQNDHNGDLNNNHFSKLVVGDVIIFRNGEDRTSIWQGQIDGTPVNNTGWWTIPVATLGSSGSFGNSTAVQVDIQYVGQSIAASGTVTSSGSPLVNEVAVFTTATDIDSDSTFTWDGTALTATSVISPIHSANAGTHLTVENGGVVTLRGFADGDTSTRRIDFDQLDGTRMAFIGQSLSANFNIENETTSGLINLIAADSGDIARNLFVGDPNGAASIYYNGASKLTTATDGIDVTGDVGGTTIGGITEASLLDKTAIETVSDKWTFEVDSATTAAHIPALQISATSSGTPAIGIGTSIEFRTETAAGSPGNQEIGAIIASEATNVGSTTEDFDLVFYTMANGATALERMRVDELGRITSNSATIPSITTDGLVNSVDIRVTGMTEADEGFVLSDGMAIRFEDRAFANDVYLQNEGVGGGSGTLTFRATSTANMVFAGTGLQLNNSGLTNAVSLTQLTTPSRLNVSQAARLQGSLYLQDQPSADTDIAANGQFWVRDRTVNQPWYTDDAGVDRPFAFAVARRVATNAAWNMNTGANDYNSLNGLALYDDGSSYTITLEDSGSTNFELDASFQIIVRGAGTITITEGATTTLYLLDSAGATDTAGGATMTAGVATIYRSAAAVYYIWGVNITA